MVRQAGGQALALRADVGVEKEVAEVFQQISASVKQIDILINNAGVELYKDFLQLNLRNGTVCWLSISAASITVPNKEFRL